MSTGNQADLGDVDDRKARGNGPSALTINSIEPPRLRLDCSLLMSLEMRPIRQYSFDKQIDSITVDTRGRALSINVGVLTLFMLLLSPSPCHEGGYRTLEGQGEGKETSYMYLEIREDY